MPRSKHRSLSSLLVRTIKCLDCTDVSNRHTANEQGVLGKFIGIKYVMEDDRFFYRPGNAVYTFI